jgi:hypothetical protein
VRRRVNVVSGDRRRNHMVQLVRHLSASGLVRDYVALIARFESKGGNGVFLDLDGFGVIKKNQSLPNLRVRILK